MMQAVSAKAFEFVERCEKHASNDELLLDLTESLRQFGYDQILLTGVPVDPSKPPEVKLEGWPVEWLDRYLDQSYYLYDYARHQILTSPRSFLWSDATGPRENEDLNRKILSEAADCGLKSGYCIPMFSSNYWQTCMSLASNDNRLSLSDIERSAVNLMSVYASNRVLSLARSDCSRSELTGREIEVLTWTAAGKSAWEVGCILSISEATVRKHLGTIRQKYGVYTTLHAVVEGLKRLDISL